MIYTYNCIHFIFIENIHKSFIINPTMKHIKIIQVLQSGALLYQDSQKNYRQGYLQSFALSTTISARYYLSQLTSLQISDCTISKKLNKIRCHNFKLIKQLLEHGVLQINEQQFSESKVFTEQEKQQIKVARNNFNPSKIEQELDTKIIDMVSHRKLLLKYYHDIKQHLSKGSEIMVEQLGKQIIIKFSMKQLMCYVPIKLRFIQHYFQLQQSKELAKFYAKHKVLSKIKIFAPYFNLANNCYECEAQIPIEAEQMILENGWGLVSLKNLNRGNIKNMRKFRQIQKQAKLTHTGIFEKPFQILSLVYTKNNIVGVVQQILEGYIYLIRTRNNQIKKIQLANISCPIQGQLGAFQCRQFARKNLINKDVNLFMKKDSGLVLQASIVRFSDNKDIEILMIENGYGLIKQEFKGTMACSKIQALQNRIKQKKRGIHNEQKLGSYHYEDLTIQHNKKDKQLKQTLMQRKLKYLQQIQANAQAIIQKIQDMLVYTVRVDSSMKIIRLKLDGVDRIQANPLLPEILQINKKSQQFTQRNLKQRNVSIDVTDFEVQSNCYIGIIKVQYKAKKVTVQQLLLAEGFVHCKGIFNEQWLSFQQLAKKQNKNIWDETLRELNRANLLDDQPKNFEGRFSWVHNGQLAFIQPDKVNQKLDYVFQKLNSENNPLPILKPQNVVVGYLCASQFQGQYCRCKIVSINEKNITVDFIDWGNILNVQASCLYDIPNVLQYLPPLCCQVHLDLVKPLRLTKIKKEHIQKVRDAIMEHQKIKVVKSHSDVVNIYTIDGKDHLNVCLIEQGLMKADLGKISDETYRNHIHETMQALRKQLVGIWEDDDEQQEDGQKYYDYQ